MEWHWSVILIVRSKRLFLWNISCLWKLELSNDVQFWTTVSQNVHHFVWDASWTLSAIEVFLSKGHLRLLSLGPMGSVFHRGYLLLCYTLKALKFSSLAHGLCVVSGFSATSLHYVDVEVFLSEAHLGLLEDPEPGSHGDPNLHQSFFVQVRQLDHSDLLRLKVRNVSL